MINLRPYQQEAVDNLRDGFALGYLRQVLQSATGSGKTIIFSKIAFAALEKAKRPCIITDRVELCKQTFKAISHYSNKIEVLTSGARLSSNPAGIIAMVETLNNRIKAGFDWEPDLIIIDEAHKGNFTKILEHWPNIRTIGATATPIGKHFHKLYQNIVNTISIIDLIEREYLAPCRAYQMEDDFSDLKKSSGEFTDKSLFQHFDKPKLYTGVIDKWIEKAAGKKTLVFCVNIKHAEETAAAFNEAGILTECVTSKTTKEERERILSAFSVGLFPVLVNCGILTAGYDEPSIECIVLNRATLSLALFLQMCGRGSRIFPNKSEFLILDFGKNHDRFGRWDAPRKWGLEPPKKKRAAQAGAVKLCPKCEAMLFVSARKCECCGYIYPEKTAEELEGVLKEVLPEVPDELKGQKLSCLTLEELYKLQLSKRYKAAFIWRVIRSRGCDALFEYAVMANYSSGWVRRQEKDLSDSDFTDRILK